MLQQRIQSHWPVLRAMLFATGVCLLLFIVRCCMIGKVERAGIYTNILLAWIPYISFDLGRDHRKQTHKIMGALALAAGLAALPAERRLITDLTHWRKDKILPVWYDWINCSIC